MGWSGRAPAPPASDAVRGTKDKEHAMAEALKNSIAFVGIDIGKNSFHVVGLDERGAIVLRQKWSRGQVEARSANIPSCLIGMEACVGAHHLSRGIQKLDHDARLMPARYVRPYSKGQKNDFRDVTTNPTAEWVARQITEAFPWDGAPGYMIRDRDRIYGTVVTRRLRAMGIRDKPIAPASPWQNGFAERLIGSIRRECLDHVVVLGEEHLRRILKNYADYYNSVRTHRSLDKDAPVSRPVQRTGSIKSFPTLGGLHHHYVRVKVFGTHRPRAWRISSR